MFSTLAIANLGFVTMPHIIVTFPEICRRNASCRIRSRMANEEIDSSIVLPPGLDSLPNPPIPQSPNPRSPSTSHYAPSTNHYAPSTNHYAPSTNHYAPSTNDLTSL